MPDPWNACMECLILEIRNGLRLPVAKCLGGNGGSSQACLESLGVGESRGGPAAVTELRSRCLRWACSAPGPWTPPAAPQLA